MAPNTRPVRRRRRAHEPSARHRLEQLGRKMWPAARAVGGVVEHARPRLRIRDELGQRLDRQRRRYDQERRGIGDQRDRLKVLLRIEAEILVERRIGREPNAGDGQRVSVGLGPHDRERAEVGVGTRPVDH